MERDVIRARLVGDRPLLMHSSRLVDPIDPLVVALKTITARRNKQISDHKEISRIEWHASLWLHNERPCIPAEAIEACFVAAAKQKRLGPAAKAGFMVPEPSPLIYDGPRDLAQLSEDKAFVFRFPVQVQESKTMRTRPRFATWSVEFEAEFLPGLIGRPEVAEILAIAGAREGIGDWRPRFGRFRVEILG